MYPLIENRQIRVFISSTFEDMKPERDYLMKNVFPRLRKQAAARDVSLVEIDLRWGITEEQAKRGEVLQICLNEIDNSHPFFIGLLGNRYGSSPDADVLKHHPILKERYPWISYDVAKQLGFTEIEMQYGALRRNEKDLNAYFFIKDVTVDDPQQIALRDAVSNDSRYTHDKYTSVEELGQKIEKEFSKLLDRLFPEKNLTQLELDRLAQRAFRRSRCHVYVRNEPDFKRLNDFLDDNSRYLVVTGESGMGKSSLIANWLSDHEKDDRYNIIYHFVGNTGGDADHGRILSRLIDEVYDLYDIPRPDDDRLGMNNWRKPEEVLQDLLMQASAMKPLLIVLDGINQLAELGEESPKLLNWLPSVPIGSKMLFSTLADDETMATFKRRQYPIYKIKALDSKPRRELIVKYLKRYGKELTPAQVARIADDAENKNTLVLRTLLDELLCFGDYQLDGIINYYLSAESIDDFFQRVLQRAERDYGEELVRDTLSLIAVSYAGMSENELIDMARILPLQWSAFYCAFAAHFTVKNGLVNFSHRYLYDAVVARYLDSDTELSYRRRVIDYFTNSGAFTNREETREERGTWSELAHQYYSAKLNKELFTLVLQPKVLEFFYKNNAVRLANIWSQLMADGYSIGSYLIFSFSSEESNARYNFFISAFCHLYFDQTDIVEKSIRKSLKSYRSLAKINPAKYDLYVSDMLDFLGIILMLRNDYAESEKYFMESIQTFSQIDTQNIEEKDFGMAMRFNNLGSVHIEQFRYPTAEQEFYESLKISRRLALLAPDKYNFLLAANLGNLGILHNKINDYVTAEKEMRESLEIYRQLALMDPDEFDHDVAVVQSNLSFLHDAMNDSAQAEKECIEALEIYRRLASMLPDKYDKDVAEQLNHLGSIHSLYDYVAAEKEYMESLEIRRRLAEKNTDEYESGIARVLYNLGILHAKTKNFKEAEKEYKESLELFRALDATNPSDFAREIVLSQSNLSSIYLNLKEYSKAENGFKEALKIVRKLASNNLEEFGTDVVDILYSLGRVHLNQEKFIDAENEFNEALKILKNLPFELDCDRTPKLMYGVGLLNASTQKYATAKQYLGMSIALFQNLDQGYQRQYAQEITTASNLIKNLPNYDRQNFTTVIQEQQKQEKEKGKGCFQSFFWLLIIGCVLIYGAFQLLAWLTTLL